MLSNRTSQISHHVDDLLKGKLLKDDSTKDTNKESLTYQVSKHLINLLNIQTSLLIYPS
jgi:chromosome segregation and condensation protein ScpB